MATGGNRPAPCPLARGTAPAKIILTGEHAVVYGFAAVALPVRNLQAHASVTRAAPGYGTVLVAHDLMRSSRLRDPDPALQALATSVQQSLAKTDMDRDPDWIIQIRSQIPVARGMGSGAAVACAAVRAVAQAAQADFSDADVNTIVFQCERHLHGNPSGIDNTVIVYNRPLLFGKGQDPVFFTPRVPWTLLLADTGEPSATVAAVQAVAALRASAPGRVEAWMEEIGEISREVHTLLCQGREGRLPALLNRNQALLRRLGVSAPCNERLIQAAMDAGALAAKVTGAGLGGQVLVLAAGEDRHTLGQALDAAGAQAVRHLVL